MQRSEVQAENTKRPVEPMIPEALVHALLLALSREHVKLQKNKSSEPVKPTYWFNALVLPHQASSRRMSEVQYS